MNQSENFTSQQASDPATPGQMLADIAALRPDLRPAVAANLAAYPGLLAWLGSLGEPAVDAALRARLEGTSAPVGGEHTAAWPVAPVAPGAPGAPTGQNAQWAEHPSSAGTHGAPAGSSPYGQPVGSAGYAPPAGPTGYGAPASTYGYQPAGAPGPGSKPRSNKVLWIVLGVVLGLIVLGIVAVIVIRGLVGSISPERLGSDPALDALYERCADEDWAACDQLYMDSSFGSDYKEFGDTCGQRTDGGSYCVDEFGSAEGSTGTDAGTAYGDDPALDALWDACEAGDGQACDDLYSASPMDSEYEEFADTCGYRTDGGAYCVDQLDAEGTSSGDGNVYGDDPTLDALWDGCEAGDDQACTDLYWAAPSSSEYETFGSTCGGREPELACIG